MKKLLIFLVFFVINIYYSEILYCQYYGVNSPVYTLASSGSDVYVGGMFTYAGVSSVKCVAKWNEGTWSPLGSGVNYRVSVIAINGSDVYVGGYFSQAGSSHAYNIARWNGASWSSLGDGLNSDVYAIAVNGSNVYAGGWFTQAGGNSANYIAKWNGSTWERLGIGVNGKVYAIAISGSDIYVGGDFTRAGGNSANYIAKWNGSTWSTLGNGMNGIVNSITIRGSDVYVGGNFAQAGGIVANNIAKWNGNSWMPLAEGLNSDVKTIVVYGSDLYVGGNFTKAGGNNVNYIAKWNGSSWSALGTGLNAGVNAISISGSDVFAGGGFTEAGSIAVDYIAKWTNQTWRSLKPYTIKYTLDGYITMNGTPVSNVLINLTGTTVSSTKTDYSGYYSFNISSSDPGNHIITPIKSGYIFSPESQTLSNIQSNQTQNFSAKLNSYSISGNITGASSVTVSLSGSSTGTTTTDASGNYSFTVNAGGNYTITPSRTGYTFNPTSQTFNNVQSSQTQNFTASLGLPDVPVLSQPSNNSTNNSINLSVSWNPSNAATSYDFQTSKDPSFGTLLINYTLNSTQYQVNNLNYSTLYHWRVRSRNTYGISSWSEIWSFTTQMAPLIAPTLIFPSNNSNTIQSDVTLSWNSASGATEYLYHLAEDINFTQFKAAHRTADLTAKEGGLSPKTTYYWRVRAENSSKIGDWSEVWKFTTLPLKPTVPQLLNPPNSSTIRLDYSNPLVTIEWTASLDATDYMIQVAENSNFSPVYKEQNGYASTNYKFSAQKNTKYYWRVKANNMGGSSNWSEMWSFNSNLIGVQQLDELIPIKYNLKQNYPNPFNPETRIEYSIPENGFVVLKIYDTFGKEVETLVNRNQSPGRYRITWKPEDLPSGVYYYKLQSGSYIETRKMLYIR
jgi:hypothetical protein